MRPKRWDSADPAAGSMSWMVTFSDLLMILLTMFVLRLSMSSIEHAQVHETFDAIKRNLAFELPESTMPAYNAETGQQAKEVKNLNPNARIAQRATQGLLSVSPHLISSEGSQGTPRVDTSIQVEATDEGVLVLLGGGLFETASDELSFKAEEAIRTISKIAIEEKASVIVAGHTDDVPIQNQRFPSNWELSAARSIAVIRQMIDAGVSPKQLRAVGYADVKPRVNNPNSDSQHLNRRVEIFLSNKVQQN